MQYDYVATHERILLRKLATSNFIPVVVSARSETDSLRTTYGTMHVCEQNWVRA
jgi:hypothetical protein